jgi:hypothetical protein
MRTSKQRSPSPSCTHVFIDPTLYYRSQGLGLRLTCSSAMAISPIKGAA